MKPPENLWPIGIVGAFAVFIAGTVTLIVVACSHRMDLVTADYYEEEIIYQSQIDRLERAHRLGASAGVTYDSVTKHITITLPAAHASTAEGRIQLYRPSAAGLDQQIPLALDPAGMQSLDAANLRAGLWKVRVLWTVEEREYFIDQSIVVSAGTS
jgi:hypothetical protein